MTVRWVQLANRRWHAWASGSRATMCGTTNTEHLRLHPARQVATALPANADRCATCARHVGLAVPRDCGSVQTSAWQGVIARKLVQQHLRGKASAQLTARYAGLLAGVGVPTDQAAVRVFQLTWSILFHGKHVEGRKRLPGLRAALDAIPDSTALARVADGVAAWQELVGTFAVVSRERFTPARVIETILRAPDPRAYVQMVRQHEPEVKFLAAVWHPDRYARYEKRPDARGLLRGGPAYWSQTSDQLVVITDDT